MTSNKEDYLKTIYDEGGAEKYVSNKSIAEKLGIAAPSVSEMLTKLQHDGLIEYKAYHGSMLTEEGLKACLDVVRTHELWEVFLMRHLGYTWWEAHEEAHLLEHIGSEKLIDRLNAYLGYPKTCPHGSLIPQKGQNVPIQNFSQKKLSELKVNEKAVIARIQEDKKLLDYLEPSGLQIGKEIVITSEGEYEGPITFNQEGKAITISFKAATQIFVN